MNCFAKKFRAVLAVLLAFALVLGLTACGEPTPTPTTTPTDEPTPPPTFNISDEWKELIDTKMEDVPEGKSFIFITDTHWPGNEKQSIELIKYVDWKLGGNVKVLFGGDAYDNETTVQKALQSLNAFWKDGMYAAFGDNAIYTRGNHDSNEHGPERIKETDVFDNTVGKNSKAVIDTESAKRFGDVVKAYYTENPKDGIDATEAGKQAEAFMKMHYYVDDEAAKVRYIMLDTAGKTWVQTNLFGSSHMYNNILIFQVEWLAEVLESTPLDYDVVVNVHSIGSEVSATQDNLIDGASKYIYQVLSMFKGAQKGKTNYVWLGGDSPVILKYFDSTASGYPVEVDFTDRAGSNTSVVVVAGHYHNDKAWYVGKDGSSLKVEIAETDIFSDAPKYADAVLTIRTACDARANQSPTDKENGVMSKEQTKNQRFDIITITEEEVVCTRIGPGEDRFFNYS